MDQISILTKFSQVSVRALQAPPVWYVTTGEAPTVNDLVRSKNALLWRVMNLFSHNRGFDSQIYTTQYSNQV